MEEILVKLIISLCSAQGFPHKYQRTNACEEWYVNCIMGQGNGTWTTQNVERCDDAKPTTYKISE